MSKKELWDKLVKLLDGEEVDIHLLFDYFSSDDLSGFVDFVEEEFSV